MSIYQNFIETKGYDVEMQECIQGTVDKLEENDTDVRNPGMLLGKIQSGKTRTFIGIIALAFDRDFEVVIVLTKGTRVLAEQTYKRLESEFKEFIDEDEVKVYDIMRIPNLTPYLRSQKLIVVVKKETKNLDRLAAFFEQYPDLNAKNTLIIDDEADFASAGFRKDKDQIDGVSMNVLATKLSEIRTGLENHYDYLQVTATPYSLYLQPAEINLNNEEFEPIRPVFTSLVPIHDRYIGGEFYFDKSSDPTSPAYYLHVELPEREFQILGRPDQRYVKNILTTSNLQYFRFSLISYLVAGAIRILQERRNHKKYKSSFIVHTETSKAKHEWQSDLVTSMFEKLADMSKAELRAFIEESYEQFVPSLETIETHVPTLDEVLDQVFNSIANGHIGIDKVNSDNDVFALLGSDGQLRLDNPFNIFIGGQILDRGITVANLIGFFYGRNPKKFQQDTVLQHSRMYGARSMDDMAVTRFYTSANIYRAMQTMHEFDSLLRQAFEQGADHDRVVFIERDPLGRIIPCAPSKILITSTQTVRSHKRFLPVGFQTKAPSSIARIVQEIDSMLHDAAGGDFTMPFQLGIEDAKVLINLIASTFDYSPRWDNEEYEWDKEIFLSLLGRFNNFVRTPELRDRIYCLVRTHRGMSRYKNNGAAFSNAPDDNAIDYKAAKAIATEIPCLILLRQNGNENPEGWRGAPFWWPVLVAPQNTRSAVFATETVTD